LYSLLPFLQPHILHLDDPLKPFIFALFSNARSILANLTLSFFLTQLESPLSGLGFGNSGSYLEN